MKDHDKLWRSTYGLVMDMPCRGWSLAACSRSASLLFARCGLLCPASESSWRCLSLLGLPRCCSIGIGYSAKPSIAHARASHDHAKFLLSAKTATGFHILELVVMRHWATRRRYRGRLRACMVVSNLSPIIVAAMNKLRPNRACKFENARRVGHCKSV